MGDELFLKHLEAEVGAHPALHHRFLQRFAQGGLGRLQLRTFALQHYQLVRVFTTYLEALVKGIPEPKVRGWVNRVLEDEYARPRTYDRSKRKAIGRLVTGLSDFSIVTTDNPASEDPAAIAAEIISGAREIDPRGERHCVVLDRREAVRAALAWTRAGDAILLAGKGHEEWQIVGGQRVPYSDRRTVEELLGL